jgi:hypothetical protein
MQTLITRAESGEAPRSAPFELPSHSEGAKQLKNLFDVGQKAGRKALHIGLVSAKFREILLPMAI